MNEYPPVIDKEKGLKNVATAVYALQALSFLLGVTYIIAVVVAYIKRGDAEGSWLGTHYRWQIRTFWFSVFWSVMGTLSAPIGIGYVILFAVMVWVIYRIAKGWMYLLEGKALYPVES
jgi:uncharacterized membrane protein